MKTLKYIRKLISNSPKKEPSHWNTVFEPLFQINASKNGNIRNYAQLKNVFIKNLPKHYANFFDLKIRFNEKTQSIEIGHSYSDFYNMFYSSKIVNDLPHFSSDRHPDGFYSKAGDKLNISPTEASSILKSHRNG